MRVARTIDALFATGDDPRCYLAPRFLFWAASTKIGGHAVWGAPDRADAERYVEVLEEGLARPSRTPENLVIDFRGMRSYEVSAFEVVARYFAEHKHEIDRRAIVVRPNGSVGAMVAGFFEVVESMISVPVVTTIEEACTRLGHPAVVPMVERVYRLRDERDGRHAAVDRLRELLAADPSLSVADAAAALKVSPRTLQSRLSRADTNYRKERDGARLDRARQLLRAGEKLAAVALHVGFSTPQHFATWFKREAGLTPSAWRAQHAE